MDAKNAIKMSLVATGMVVAIIAAIASSVAAINLGLKGEGFLIVAGILNIMLLFITVGRILRKRMQKKEVEL